MPQTRAKTTPLTVAAILNLEHSHGQAILRGIARAAGEQPGVLLLRFSHTHLKDRAWLRSLDADGLIVKATTSEDAAALTDLGCPVIDIAAESGSHGLARVTTDNMAVGAMAAGYFLRRGFRQYGYAGIRGHGASILREAGFAEAVAMAGLPCGHFVDGFDQVQRRKRHALARRLRNWLAALPVPSGIFCSDDLVAAEVVRVAVHLGRNVPGEIAVLGCNNDPIEVKSSMVEISSVDLNSERIGYEAMRTMLAGLHEKKPLPTIYLRPLKIVTRRSTERFAVPDEAVMRALEFIHEQTAGTFSVADVTRAAGVSRRLLEMKFQRFLGFSIYSEVQHLRIERVIGLMSDHERRLADIAHAVGFSSPAKLSAAFRAFHHSTPSVFRATHFGEASRL